MLPTLREVLQLPALDGGGPVIRAGEDRLDRPVRWVHVSEISDIAGLLEGGELILTTGIALPDSPSALRRYVAELAAVDVCGLVVELGRRYRSALPAKLVSAAATVDLPLVELHRETPFVAVTQAVHTAILDARMRELGAADDRERHRTLLTELVTHGPGPVDLVPRADALLVPLRRRAITGVVVRAGDVPATPGALRAIAARVAETLRVAQVPALVGLLDDRHVAVVMSHPDESRVEDTLRQLGDAVHGLPRGHGDAPLVIGVGVTVTDPARAATSLREALRVGETASSLTPGRSWFRTPDLRLRGLVHSLGSEQHVRDYVDREIGPLLAHPDGVELLAVLSAFCRHGGRKTPTAGALYLSRASLYDRLAKLGRILQADLDDAEVVLSLHFAVLAHDTLRHPETAATAVR